MPTVATRPRLALARPAEHPLAEAVRQSGWVAVPFPFMRTQASALLPPRPVDSCSALIVLSPAAGRAVAAGLTPGTLCLVQGVGTAEAMGREDLDIEIPLEARAEALWALLRERFPKGGEFLLARGERSREYLEVAAQNSVWRIHPWVTHREVAAVPFPAWPEVEAVLALSPLQAEVLAPLSARVQRFAWGEATAAAFERAGVPAQDRCLPRPSQLGAMLARHIKQEESPC